MLQYKDGRDTLTMCKHNAKTSDLSFVVNRTGRL